MPSPNSGARARTGTGSAQAIGAVRADLVGAIVVVGAVGTAAARVEGAHAALALVATAENVAVLVVVARRAARQSGAARASSAGHLDDALAAAGIVAPVVAASNPNNSVVRNS